MFRRFAIATLSLLLLTQSFVPAWAAPATSKEPAAATDAATPPCHGHGVEPSQAAPTVAMDCCEAGDCAHCTAGCVAAPALPAAAASPTSLAPAHFARPHETASGPAAPPPDLLRPPITALR